MLFLLVGLHAAYVVVFQLFVRNSININLGLLGFPVYFGLMRYSDRWRRIALLALWISMLLCAIAFVVGLFASGPARLSVVGVYVREVPPTWISLAMIPFAFLLRWQSQVLQRAHIVALFDAPTPHAVQD